MNPTDEDSLRWHRKHRTFEAQRRLREVRARKNRRKNKVTANRAFNARFLPVHSPAQLDFDSNYESTIKFLEQVRKTAQAGGYPNMGYSR